MTTSRVTNSRADVPPETAWVPTGGILVGVLAFGADRQSSTWWVALVGVLVAIVVELVMLHWSSRPADLRGTAQARWWQARIGLLLVAFTCLVVRQVLGYGSVGSVVAGIGFALSVAGAMVLSWGESWSWARTRRHQADR